MTLKYGSTTGKMMNQKENANVEQEVIISENIQAPISEGQVLGEVIFKMNGEPIANTSLVAGSSIEKLNFLNMSKKVIDKWFFLFREK